MSGHKNCECADHSIVIGKDKEGNEILQCQYCGQEYTVWYFTFNPETHRKNVEATRANMAALEEADRIASGAMLETCELLSKG